jgi:hypothetical protein
MSFYSICEGRLDKSAGLYERLREPRLSGRLGIGRSSHIEVRKLNGSHKVYLLSNSDNGSRFILKSFYDSCVPERRLLGRLEREYRSLRMLKDIGSREYCRTVKPLCKDDRSLLLFEEYVDGFRLGDVVKRSMSGGDSHELYDRLDMIAGYLSEVHKRTLNDSTVRTGALELEIRKHALQAAHASALDRGSLRGAFKAIHRWCDSGRLRHTHTSIVHGDATPSNFLFCGGKMISIDLERCGRRDPAYDLGMLAGELCHFAMSYGGGPERAEPFIGHMYWTYAGNFPDQYKKFLELTSRNPLYMANSLFRIARNTYIGRKYREELAYKALDCLTGPIMPKK